MAKQRTRPWYAQAAGLFTHPKLFELDGEEIAVWVWLLCTNKQDELGGRIPPAYTNVEFIKYSARIKTVEAVQHALDVIVKNDCASYDDEGFLVIKNWEKYQKCPSDHPEEVAKRVKSHREKKKAGETGCNKSTKKETTRNTLKRDVTDCNELKRDETTTVQYSTVQDSTVQDRKKTPPFPPEGERDVRPDEIFEFWCETMEKNPAMYKLTSGRRQKINARLKNYSVEEIKHAIVGCRYSTHHMGHNDRGVIYDDLELICRNDEKLERFRDMGITARRRGGSPPQKFAPGSPTTEPRDIVLTPEEEIARLERNAQ